MRSIHHSQNTAFLAAVALLFSAASVSVRDPFEAQAPASRASRIQPAKYDLAVVKAHRDAGEADGLFYGFGIYGCFSQGEGNNVSGKVSRAANDRLAPVAIIDGHPHNPSTLLV